MVSPLCVFSDDWGRHPSSCQHLVQHLLASRPVYWVNTIGTRAPALDWATMTRVAGKLRGWFLPKRQPADRPRPANLHVHNPKMWPYFRTRFDRALNQRLLMRGLKAVPGDAIAVTTLPIVADLVGRLPAQRWVYYCVDDFSQWPGLDQRAMDRMERALVQKVDRIVAVSETLQARMKSLGRDDASLLTHGVDVTAWRQEASPQPGPIVFWGVIDQRMDAGFIAALARQTTVPIHLIGPKINPDPALWAIPRVVDKPAVPFEELPAIAAAASVLIMPYVDAPVTRAMQPLKLKEYLATGKPVVVRDLPANRVWGDALDLAATADDFATAVVLRLGTGLPAGQAMARERLHQESWSAKAEAFARVLEQP
jgi:glycosyltransferase involved in cell wall biosynthesis